MTERPIHFWDEDEWKEIIAGWPEAVQRGFATRLRVVQQGSQPQSRAKPLSGFDITVWELWHRDGQRVIYTIQFVSVSGRIDVLDAFEKDSSDGRKMRKSDKERIKKRVAAHKQEMEALAKRQQTTRRGLH